MKPMLAHKFNDHQHKIVYPVYIQPKLNGIRGIYNHGVFQSRDEHLWKPDVLSHIVHELLACTNPDQILDGELYVHGWSLQKINGAVAVTRNAPDKLTPIVEYHIFDILHVNDMLRPFAERAQDLFDLQQRITLHKLKKVHVVPTTRMSLQSSEFAYNNYRKLGYEGIMYRDGSKPYGHEQLCGNKDNRWTYLLKRKAWVDDEFTILDFNLTTGEKGNRGFQLTCKTKEGRTFNVGSGLAHEEMEACEASPPIGKLARVRYEMLSDDLIPLKPTLEAIL